MILLGLSLELTFLRKLVSRNRELRALAAFMTAGRSGLFKTSASLMESMAERILRMETSPMPDNTLLQTRVRLILSRWLTMRRKIASMSLTSLRS